MVAAITDVYWLIVTAVCIIIGLGGGIYSAWNFWDSATNDRPEEKKKGVTLIIITVVALVLILGIAIAMWNVMNGYLADMPSEIPDATTPTTAALRLF